MLKAIRQIFRGKSIGVHAQTLPGADEQANGADGIMVFRIGNEVKVGIFESKWPRIKQANYAWDYLHTTRRISHFSEQIQRQHVWGNSIAIWEMFFNEDDFGAQSPPFESCGSSCLWHDDAYDYMNCEAVIFNRWTTDDLKKVLAKDGRNIYSIVFDIVSCKKGKRHDIDLKDNTVRIISPVNDNIVLNVPLPLTSPLKGNQEVDKRITQFMEKEGLTSYIYIGVDEGLRNSH